MYRIQANVKISLFFLNKVKRVKKPQKRKISKKYADASHLRKLFFKKHKNFKVFKTFLEL
jgi:hypothetical protein